MFFIIQYFMKLWGAAIQYTPAVLPTPLFLSQDFRHLFYQMNMNMKKRFHEIFRFPEVIREIRKNVCQLIRLL